MPRDSIASAVARHGAGLYGIALLLVPPAQAPAVLLDAVMRAAPAASAAEDALLSALLRHRDRPRLQRPWLPRPLRRIRPYERALLGVWLLQHVEGARLAQIANVSPDTLVVRLVGALLRLNPQLQPASDPLYRAALGIWLTQRLGLTFLAPSAASPADTPGEAAWAQALAQTAELLQAAVGGARLPPACARAIAEALHVPPTPPPARRIWVAPLLLALGALLGGVLLRSTPPPSAAPAVTEPSARTLVQGALTAWLERPAAGVRHRRVVALDETAAPAARLSTDVWDEAGSARHRVEVRSGATLVAWQVGDGGARLRYAADPRFSACRWDAAQTAGMLDGSALVFETTPAVQRAALDQRLLGGSYGAGYTLLERALAADDLASYGARGGGGTREIVLRFTDRAATPPRGLLLTLDSGTRELRAVHAIQVVANQRVARELWRLESDTAAAPVLMTPPPWPVGTRAPAPMFDPGCPALMPERVPSLRIVAGSAQWSRMLWLPRSLPAGADAGVLLSAQNLVFNAQLAGGTRAVLAGAGRQLSLAVSSRPAGSLSAPGEVVGRWRIVWAPDGAAGSATVCLSAPAPALCGGPLIDIATHGWERAALTSLVQTLAPLDLAMWSRYEPLFVDPRPLDPAVRSALIAAVQTSAGSGDGVQHSLVTRTVRVDPRRPDWPDPYHLPLGLIAPPRYTIEQWTRSRDGQVLEYRQRRRTPDGQVLAVAAGDLDRSGVYWRATGKQFIVEGASLEDAPQPLPDLLVSGLFGAVTPITLAVQGDTLVLEQRAPGPDDPLERTNPAPVGPWLGGVLSDSTALRLVLDGADRRPLEAALVAEIAPGEAVTLLETTVAAGLDATGSFELPPVAPDTLTITEGTEGESVALSSPGMDLRLPARALSWPASEGVVIESDRNSSAQNPVAVGRPIDSATILPNLASQIYLFDTTLLKATRYRVAALGGTVTIRQGPRDFLRHVLRYQSQSMEDETHTWTASRPATLSIDGRSLTGWIIEHRFETALVVEVDDVLLYITASPGIALDGPLLDELGRLRWTTLGA